MLGALFIVFVPEYAADVDEALAGVIYGAVLILVMYLARRGAVGLAGVARVARRAAAAEAEYRREEASGGLNEGGASMLSADRGAGRGGARCAALTRRGCGRDERGRRRPAPGVTEDSIKLGGSYPFAGRPRRTDDRPRGAKAHFD